MATLEEYLKTGQLGPINLGMTLEEVESELGEPESQSKKKMPLVWKYGALELTFWSGEGTPFQLRRFSVNCRPEGASLPDAVRPTDVPSCDLGYQEFRNFTDRIGYPPIHMTGTEAERQIVFPSGVKVTFSEGTMHSLEFSQRQLQESPPIELGDAREPTLDQIAMMLDEAERLTRMNVPRLALIAAWAAMEAALRRAAVRVGIKKSIGVQPTVLVRELHSARNLDREEYSFLDAMRQVRSAVVHGLAPVPVEQEDIDRIVALTKKLLSESEVPARAS